ncbi:hypothetical protein BDR04DRAFT_1106232 [Suillus decipiens]|nr:hypothetical protein BDR04DRAFT_1106232 [Suillus decipiens]
MMCHPTPSVYRCLSSFGKSSPFMSNPLTLIAFGLVSTLCHEAASMILRYVVPVPKKKPEYLQDQHPFPFPHTASFSVAHSRRCACCIIDGWAIDESEPSIHAIGTFSYVFDTASQKSDGK